MTKYESTNHPCGYRHRDQLLKRLRSCSFRRRNRTGVLTMICSPSRYTSRHTGRPGPVSFAVTLPRGGIVPPHKDGEGEAKWNAPLFDPTVMRVRFGLSLSCFCRISFRGGDQLLNLCQEWQSFARRYHHTAWLLDCNGEHKGVLNKQFRVDRDDDFFG